MLAVRYDFDHSASLIDFFPHRFMHFVARMGETVLWVVKEARVCRGIPKLAAERSNYPAGKHHCRSGNQTKSDGFIEVCIEMVSRISNVSNCGKTTFQHFLRMLYALNRPPSCAALHSHNPEIA